MSAAHMPTSLQNENLSCLIAPYSGCSVLQFRSKGTLLGEHDWFRPTPVGEEYEAAETACFPLVPYSGRIAAGRLHTAQGLMTLPTGLLGDANALHGSGWIRPWTTESVSSDSACFVLDGADPTWPFAFEARQVFHLTPTGLQIALSVRNLDDRPMPAGIGLHPYFAGRGIVLKAAYDTLWQIDEKKLFAGKAAVPDKWNAIDGLALEGSELEHGFSGWDGNAQLTWPDRSSSLTVEASGALRHLVIYSKHYGADGNGFVCVEPVSHSVDGFNLFARGIEGTGSAMLEPGEALSGSVSFTIGPHREGPVQP